MAAPAAASDCGVSARADVRRAPACRARVRARRPSAPGGWRDVFAGGVARAANAHAEQMLLPPGNSDSCYGVVVMTAWTTYHARPRVVVGW